MYAAVGLQGESPPLGSRGSEGGVVQVPGVWADVVVRYEPKTFRQRRRVVKMDGTSAGISWEYNIKGISRVLYRLPKVAAADRVLIVEGEKDVGDLEKLGFVATCNPGGACTHAGKWLKNYTEALEGKRVVVLPDNDPPGQQHANVVVQAIRHRVAEFKMLAIPEARTPQIGLPPARPSTSFSR